MKIDAIYEDRPRGVRVPVRLSRQGDQLVITRADGRELDRWPWRAVAQVEGDFPDGAARYGLAADAHAALVVQDVALFNAMAPQGTGQKRHGKVFELPLLVWIGGATVSVLLLLFVIMPMLATILAPMVPDRWQRRIGDQVSSILVTILTDEGGDANCRAPAGQAALDQLMARLPRAEVPPFRLRVIQSKIPNAFALPGHVVVTDSILRLSPTPEAALGVIAHEVGHIVHGHSMERVIRYSLASTLVSMMVGDVGGGILAVGVTQMSESSFSQDEEREADAYAADRLLDAGYSPAALGGLFEALKLELKLKESQLEKWLGSHPQISERVATLAAYPAPANPTPALTGTEWKALQAICEPPASDVPQPEKAPEPARE